jgi:hypothetical protein
MRTASDPRAPCIIGVARRTWHPVDVPDGGRAAFEKAETDELIGRTVTLTPKDAINLARLN